jgi:hypothetical protein
MQRALSAKIRKFCLDIAVGRPRNDSASTEIQRNGSLQKKLCEQQEVPVANRDVA